MKTESKFKYYYCKVSELLIWPLYIYSKFCGEWNALFCKICYRNAIFCYYVKEFADKNVPVILKFQKNQYKYESLIIIII